MVLIKSILMPNLTLHRFAVQLNKFTLIQGQRAFNNGKTKHLLLGSRDTKPQLIVVGDTSLAGSYFNHLNPLCVCSIPKRGIQFTSSSEFDDKTLQIDALKESLLSEQDIIKEPNRNKFGVIKAFLIITAGIYFGAWLAMMGANLLEDLEIFVEEDEDDD